MKRRLAFVIVGLGALTASFALAQASKDTTKSPPKAPATTHKEPQLPPGMTKEDAEACAAAATPGPMHQLLAECVGTWNGKTTCWMGPDAEPVKSECTSTVSSMFDGRFNKCEWSGDMPNMGPFNGFGLYGFDNTAQKFQSTWIDNHTTSMLQGTGALSSDAKTMTWTYTFTCPITKKPAVLREIERITGKDTRTMEVWSTDPKSGKEFKMMEAMLTRKPGTGTVTIGH